MKEFYLLFNLNRVIFYLNADNMRFYYINNNMFICIETKNVTYQRLQRKHYPDK